MKKKWRRSAASTLTTVSVACRFRFSINSALETAEPNLRKGLAGGLLVPEDAVLYPPCAARFLIERAQASGAVIQLGCPVAEIGDGRVRLEDGSELTSGVIINAAGNGAALLTPGLSVKKRKGHLVITDRYPGFVRHQLVELGYLKSAHSTTGDSVAFNVQPRKTGQILIGSSRQYGVEEKQVDNPDSSPHADTRGGIHAGSGANVDDQSVDRISRRDTGQAAIDRTLAGGFNRVSRYRA